MTAIEELNAWLVDRTVVRFETDDSGDLVIVAGDGATIAVCNDLFGKLSVTEAYYTKTYEEIDVERNQYDGSDD